MKRKPQKRTQGMNWIAKDKGLAIYLRDEFRCVYCGKDLHGAGAGEVGLDHVKCYSAGGSNDESNLVTCCRSCNSSRGDKKINDWADEPTRKAIKRNTRRKLDKYRKLAKEILGETASWDEAMGNN